MLDKIDASYWVWRVKEKKTWWIRTNDDDDVVCLVPQDKENVNKILEAPIKLLMQGT